MKILIFNAGSSSHKSSLYEVEPPLRATPPDPLWEGQADWSQVEGQSSIQIKANGHTIKTQLPTQDRSKIIHYLLEQLWTGPTQVIRDLSEIAVVGHRVVHGGHEFRESVRVNQYVKDRIRDLAAYAPLHNPANLEGIEAIEKVKNDLPQIAVFDTAFHNSIPPVAHVYPGPYEWYQEGIRRYGFHGISHQYCTQRSAQILGKDSATFRLVNCHLGNGCSLAAIKNGKSIDTTMGFTPLEGLMMGTRSGSIDPSILIYLMREKSYSADRMDTILNKESGLKGISGVSSDVRDIHVAIQDGNERAKLALDIFIYRLRYFIGSMTAIMGGMDVLTFTGGIGENDEVIRAQVCESFGFLNLKIDPVKNNASPADQEISTPDSAVRVLIVHTQEDWEIARDCWNLMRQ